MPKNFVSYDNAEDLMTGINNKKDDKPITITWANYNALTPAEREGKHYIITGGPKTGLFTSDIAHDGTHTAADMFDNITIVIPKNITNMAAYKNASGNRGEDITSYWKDGSLWDRIAGTNGYQLFDDLYLGDYIELDTAITASGSDTTGTKKIVIGEFDAMNNYQLNGQTDMTDYFHHLLMVPDTHFGKAAMNSSNTTVGGYVGSAMHATVLGQYNTANSISAKLYAQLGSHLKKTKELLTNSINASGYNRLGANSGCANNWTWVDCYSVLLSEIETYGSIVWSSSGYDTGNAKKQIAAFANDEQLMLPQGIYFWLKDIATSAGFCSADGYHGNAYYDGASHAYFVRPRFILA